MATILIRSWLTEQSFKNRLEAQESRAGATRSLLENLGMKLISVYWSSTEACAITLCEGDAANIPAIRKVSLRPGVIPTERVRFCMPREKWRRTDNARGRSFRHSTPRTVTKSTACWWKSNPEALRYF